MPEITVSIVMPCFNAAGTVGRALASVLATGVRRAEIIAVDDGSGDDTWRVLTDLAARHGSGEVVVRAVRSPANEGAAAARNRGLAVCRGEYIAFLDADDLYCTNRFVRCLPALAEDRALDAVFEPFEYVRLAPAVPEPSEPGTILAPERLPCLDIPGVCYEVSADPFRDFLNSRLRIHTSTVTLRASVFRKLPAFRPSLRTAEDMELWLRLLSLGSTKQLSGIPVSGYVRHRDSLSTTAVGSSPVSLDALLALTSALQWMRASGAVTPARIEATASATEGKLFYYVGQCLRAGRTPPGMLQAMGSTALSMPRLCLSRRFWSSLLRILALRLGRRRPAGAGIASA